MIDISRDYIPNTQVVVLEDAWTSRINNPENYLWHARPGCIGLFCGVDEDGDVRVKFSACNPGFIYFGPEELKIYDPYEGDEDEDEV